MHDFQRKFSMKNSRKEIALKVAHRNAKTSLKNFEIPMGSWKQIAQGRSKWRGLINEEAAFYEKKK